MEKKQISFGQAVALRANEIRKEHNLSINKLSNLSLIPKATLIDLLHARYDFPSSRGIIEFCRYFNLTLAEFYDSPYFYLEFIQYTY